jgi:NAD-dependent SIR2 family protein deacetylase
LLVQESQHQYDILQALILACLELQIYSEAQASKAAQGHYAVAQLQELGLLQRHYTMNIDGLAEVVGMDTWHPEFNPQGITVEMHGNIR